ARGGSGGGAIGGGTGAGACDALGGAGAGADVPPAAPKSGSSSSTRLSRSSRSGSSSGLPAMGAAPSLTWRFESAPYLASYATPSWQGYERPGHEISAR